MIEFKNIFSDFNIEVRQIDETFPTSLQGGNIAQYISEQKAKAFISEKRDELIITADTIVWHKNKCLGKPKNNKDALNMLTELSNNVHKVITAVGFLTKKNLEIIHKTTKVKFGKISKEDLISYTKKDKPYDKAGSYGIQDWFGLISVVSINGSYSNIVGFPTYEVYNKIKEITSKN